MGEKHSSLVLYILTFDKYFLWSEFSEVQIFFFSIASMKRVVKNYQNRF